MILVGSGFRCDADRFTTPRKPCRQACSAGKENPSHSDRILPRLVVIGEMNSISLITPARLSAPNAATRQTGITVSSSTGMNRLRCAFQNGVPTKSSSHHCRQCRNVLMSMPNASRNCVTRRTFGPCIIAATNTTTTPAYTPQEAHRRRCMPLAAAFLLAAETMAFIPAVHKLARAATGLALVVCPVQPAAAPPTTIQPHCLGSVRISLFKKLVKPPIL
jgi:hypothetical protein